VRCVVGRYQRIGTKSNESACPHLTLRQLNDRTVQIEESLEANGVAEVEFLLCSECRRLFIRLNERTCVVLLHTRVIENIYNNIDTNAKQR